MPVDLRITACEDSDYGRRAGTQVVETVDSVGRYDNGVARAQFGNVATDFDPTLTCRQQEHFLHVVRVIGDALIRDQVIDQDGQCGRTA